MEDGTLTSSFLPHILKRIGNYKICVDQVFPRSGLAWNVLVEPLNQCTARQLYPRMLDYVLRVSNVHTSLHQASEWGVHGIQGSFLRFKKQLLTDSRKQRIVLESIVLIHNFRTELVGSNQIKTVFDESERVISIEGCD